MRKKSLCTTKSVRVSQKRKWREKLGFQFAKTRFNMKKLKGECLEIQTNGMCVVLLGET